MRTVTADDLQTRLPTILAWLEAGEEVVVKPGKLEKQGDAVTEARPEAKPAMIYLDRSGKAVPAPPEWQSKSAVFQRPLAPQPVLTQADLDELHEDLHGHY